MNACCVYFMRPIGEEGPVKIGYSYRKALRLEEIKPWCPWPVEIAASFPGDCTVERQFHTMFAHLRQHGEWFRAAPELTETIQKIADGRFARSELPEPKYVGARRNIATLERQVA